MSGAGLTAFDESAHGSISCRGCHGGQDGVLTKDEAHVGMVADPSEILGSNQCASCHHDLAARTAHSLHTTMKGYHTLFTARTGRLLTEPDVQPSYDAQCNKCHASCGSCHVSRPKSAGGGFIQGHNFARTPDMTLQCMACHGSRVGEEYTGAHEGLRPDVHYVPHAMHCKACHNEEHIHGTGIESDTRYAIEDPVSCRTCHTIGAENAYHAMHGQTFQCQVCHAQSYKNCADCHAGSGVQQPSWLSFKIGRNPIPSQREGAYVVLRHVPISEQTYSSWGVSTPGYASLPTFKYATPHNIVRRTARTDTTGGLTCDQACHQSPAVISGFFLRQVDLDSLPPAEREANQALIVPDGPPPW
jgi:thiosulfate/3-mercaptopyruvate sulfurtransferase